MVNIYDSKCFGGFFIYMDKSASFFQFTGFCRVFLWFKEYLQAKPFPLFNLKDLYRVNYLIPYFRFTGFLQGLGSLSSVMYVLFILFGQYLHDNNIHMTLAHKV